MRRSRTGLSLLEILVVIAIVALLIGMILPAIQKARSVGAGIASKNNIRSMILATHSFSATHQGKIPNVVADHPNRGVSVIYAIMPYLELDPSKVSDDDRLQVFISPTDPSYEIQPEGKGNCSYAANAAVFRPGVTLVSGFPDGLSNTIGYGEHYARCGRTQFLRSLANVEVTDSTGKPVPSPLPEHKATFADPQHPDVLPVTTGNPPVTVGSIANLTFQVAPAPDLCDGRLLQAPQSGSLAVALMDGSIRTISSRVSPTIFWASVTPGGGEVIADW